ncbi:AI-2E family transporter [Methanolobus psychrotolerans]|uniref:AI-2E family transporter n=1 Tax=Methanolobus psychrotolerans TaxID=1874706 RepID=UPI000B916245|nr:AI-2E family transporter [Methanolobus psychrotolerans]
MKNLQTDTFSAPTKLLFVIVAVVLLTIGMREIASILIPILFSLFATLIFAPLIYKLQKRGVHPVISIALVILLFLVIVVVVSIFTVSVILQFNELTPAYQSNLEERVDSLMEYIPYIENLDISLGSIARDVGVFLLASLASIFSGTVSAATTVGLIIITTAFLLLDAVGISKKVQRETEERFTLAVNIKNLGGQVMDYAVIRTKTNLVMGIGTTIILLIADIEFAFLWGFLAFLLGYIPYIGLALAVIPPAILALLQYSPLGALAIVVAVLIVNGLSDILLFPSLAGKGLEISPSVVFLSLIYWGFVLGPAGALISTPLTMVVRTVLGSFEDTHWIAELMGESKSK